jgi:hypothetical protein
MRMPDIDRLDVALRILVPCTSEEHTALGAMGRIPTSWGSLTWSTACPGFAIALENDCGLPPRTVRV